MGNPRLVIRSVYEGADHIVTVEGGVVRKKTPEAGIIVDVPVGTEEVFIPWSVLDAERAKVRSRSQQRRVDVQKKGGSNGNGE